MATIKAKKIPKKELSIEHIIALFCYKFPSYRYDQARQLSYRRLVQMLKVAEKEDAKKMVYLARAVAGPHTKKMSGTIKLIDELKGIING